MTWVLANLSSLSPLTTNIIHIMKRKRISEPQAPNQTPPEPSNTPTSSNNPIEVIDVDEHDEVEAPKSSFAKRSWVWTHFNESADGLEATCQVALKKTICGRTLKKDRSGSTKNFHEHLLKVHRLVDPKLSKKLDQSQSDISRYMKDSKLGPKLVLNTNNLKTAIAYFVAEADLPFSIVERKSFQNLIRLVNEQATLMASNITRHSLSSHMTKIYINGQQKMKSEYLSKQRWISFTQDAWTAPNVTAFLAITAHFIDANFQMTDLTIAVPHIQGNHTGQNFANMFLDVLEKYSLQNKLHTITADNASTNGRMGREIQILIPSFTAKTNYLGCIAHVINLAAKAGLAVLGSLDDVENCDLPNNENDQLNGSSIMSISNLTSVPDGVSLNLKTIVKRIHGLCMYVRFSPQRRERFKAVVDFAQPNLRELGYNFTVLDIDVSTRWNSTFHMIQRAIELRQSCVHFCNENAEVHKFKLSESEWNMASSMMKLLLPLSEATEILCASKYPSLNKALPIYVVLIKHLKKVQHGLYDQGQLIQPASQIIDKIEQYLLDALEKPSYFCAMILDPTFKITFWKKMESFIVNHYNYPVDKILETFRNAADFFVEKHHLKKAVESSQPSIPTASASRKPSFFSSELYQNDNELEANQPDSVQSEISRYLKEDLQPEVTDILRYWSNNRKNYPILSEMARMFLSIPATSASSERVFSKGRRIISWQRASLNPSSVEELLCVKEWFQLSETLF